MPTGNACPSCFNPVIPFKDEVDEEEHLDAALRQDEEGNTTRPAIIPRDDGVTSMFGKVTMKVAPRSGGVEWAMRFKDVVRQVHCRRVEAVPVC